MARAGSTTWCTSTSRTADCVPVAARRCVIYGAMSARPTVVPRGTINTSGLATGWRDGVELGVVLPDCRQARATRIRSRCQRAALGWAAVDQLDRMGVAQQATERVGRCHRMALRRQLLEQARREARLG